MQPRLRRIGSAVAIAIGAAALAPLAFAQQHPAAQSQAPTHAATPSASSAGPAPTDAELRDFAHAAKDVQYIREQAQPQIDIAKTPDDRAKLQLAAEHQMEAAVRNNHLTVQRYQQIAMAAQTNATIRTKVMKLLGPPAAS